MIWVIIIRVYFLSIVQGVINKIEAVISKFVRASIGSRHNVFGPLTHEWISAVISLLFILFVYKTEIWR